MATSVAPELGAGAGVAPAPGAVRARHARPRTSRLPDLLVGLAFVVAELAVLWRTRPAPYWGDSYEVYRHALAWPERGSEPVHHALRIGTLIPVRGAIELLGRGQGSYYAWPALCSVLLVASTYALARQLGGFAAAVLATTAMVLTPALVDAGSGQNLTALQLTPDVPCAAFLTLAYALLVAGSRRRNPLWLAGAGAALGWAYLVREYAAFVFPAFLVAVLALKVRPRRWVWLVLPALACYALELANGQYVYGWPFARLTEASKHGSEGAGATTKDRALNGFWDALQSNPRGTTIGVLALVAVAGVVVAHRHRLAALVLGSWLAAFWLALTLTGGWLHPEAPSLRNFYIRYWIPVLPAAYVGSAVVAVALGGLLLRLLPWRSLRVVVGSAAVVAALAWYAVPSVDLLRHPGNDEPAWNAVRAWLVHNEPRRVLAEPRAARTLTFYTREPVGGDVVWGGAIDAYLGDFDPSRPPALNSSFRGHLPATRYPADDALLVAPTGPKGEHLPGTSLYFDAPMDDDGWTEVLDVYPLRLYVADRSALAKRLGLG
ncbi:dolichyl-phosphate-mannose-protein mannosyltransferase [Motilibacter peucedani]|uniref:Dolichyl-phosphate-mannose-protein mannosyltransferase n=1 Tax=Motilibacter peucedani TaxID=598650 RepID=A0A420XUB3_9ACTN|nr:glycosyltransferase family 39 protein [Motilibacter peucedani]RKS80321.1 dolichyl-phosphate-mannose-protein mannosyltransferase [Motilibacter peucedani]